MENNSYNKTRKVRHDDYSDGYDPEAIEYDLITIRQLMRGKKQLTMQLSQEIYYKIKLENIQFQSDKGAEFLEELSKNITNEQIQTINKAVLRKKQHQYHKRQLWRLNKKIAIGMFATALTLCVVCLNWNLILDFRTNYETQKLQEKIAQHEENLTDSPMSNPGDPDGTAAQLMANGAQTADEMNDTQGETAGLVSSEGSMAGETAILSKFTVLYEENPDFAGWLRIPGTRIDYPVMSREGDNNYYLDKNFEQKQDKNGLLILDYRNDVTADQQNLIIYGHNMRTGVMFGTLQNYKEKAFCEEHMTIRFDTLYEECEYRVVAAMLGSVAYEDEDVFRYYDAIDISTEENFNAFKENVMNNAIYTTDETIMYGDNCLILSTCDNYKEDGRFVVIAKKIE